MAGPILVLACREIEKVNEKLLKGKAMFLRVAGLRCLVAGPVHDSLAYQENASRLQASN